MGSSRDECVHHLDSSDGLCVLPTSVHNTSSATASRQRLLSGASVVRSCMLRCLHTVALPIPLLSTSIPLIQPCTRSCSLGMLLLLPSLHCLPPGSSLLLPRPRTLCPVRGASKVQVRALQEVTRRLGARVDFQEWRLNSVCGHQVVLLVMAKER